MGTFGPGILLDSTTMRPVTGRVLKVLEVGTDLPLVSDPAVVATNSRGYYGQFTVPGREAVLIRGGSVEEVIAAVDRSTVTELEALADVDLAGAQDGDVLTKQGSQWVPQSGTSGTGLTPDPDYPGYYRIDDDDGGTPVDYPPTVTLGVSTEGLLATATFTASDPEGAPVTVAIDWGDGQATDPATSPATHTYTTGGIYTITATATANGRTGTDAADATVSEPTTPTGYQSAALALGPVVHLPLSEAQPPAFDIQGAATPAPAATWGSFVDSPVGSATRSYYMDSSASPRSINLGSPGALGELPNWSFAALVRMETLTHTRYFLNCGPHADAGSFFFRVTNTGTAALLARAGSVTWAESPAGWLAAGQDYHLAATYDGTTLRIYRNGVEGGSKALSGYVPSPGLSWSVGRGDTATVDLRGWIAQVSIFDKALTATEISDLASAAGLTGA